MDQTTIQNHIQAAKSYINELEEYFEPLRAKYVPMMGKAATVGGEIIRAMDRLVYRWYNDGDRPYVGYGNETCNSSFRYLYTKLRGEYGEPTCPDLDEVDCDEEYWDALADLMCQTQQYLESHPEVFEWENNEDSRPATDEDRERSRGEYDDSYDDDCDW